MKKSIIALIVLCALFAPKAFAATAVKTTATKKTSKTTMPAKAPAPTPLPPTVLHTSFTSIEAFRTSSNAEIIATTNKTEKDIDAYQKSPSAGSKPLDGTRKPILYVKLFLFLILGFIFANQIIFYGLFALIIFFLIRFLYRKIRHR